MRVLFECRSIIPNKSGGIENYLYMLVKAWQQEFPDDKIILHIPPNTETEYIKKMGNVPNYKIDPVYKVITNIFLKNRILRYFPLLLAKLFPKLQDSLFGLRQGWMRHLDENCDVIIYPFQREKFRHDPNKSILVMHDFREWDLEGGDNSVRKEQENGIREISKIVTSWPYPFDRLNELWPQYGNKYFQVPFLYDPFNIDKKFTYSEPKYLYYASANAPHKNHENLIEGLCLYNKNNPTNQLKIICTGPIDSERNKLLQSIIQKFRVQEYFLFLGFVSRDEVFNLYENCFGVITSTTYEAFSGAVLEAFRFKKPVLASNIKPISSFLKSYSLKVTLFDPSNPNDIANSIQSFSTNYSDNLLNSLIANEKLKFITPTYTVTSIKNLCET